MLRVLTLRGNRATAEASFAVTCKGHSDGEYFADLLVENVLAVELNCAERLANQHTAQCLNYLRASGVTLCSGEFPEAQGRVEADCAPISDLRDPRGRPVDNTIGILKFKRSSMSELA